MYSFSYLGPVFCFMSSSNCCFLTCIQISQEAGQVVWYSHVFQNFPQFIVIHTVKGFGIVNKAEIDVFLELSCFFNDQADVGNLISGSSAFSKFSFYIWKFSVHGIFLLFISQEYRSFTYWCGLDTDETINEANFVFNLFLPHLWLTLFSSNPRHPWTYPS